MKVICLDSNKQTIYFDVDDTLIFESEPNVENSFLLNDGAGWSWYRVHETHVKELQRLYFAGNQIVVWTHHQLGANWSEQVCRALGLDKLTGGLEIICIAKPDLLFDDMPAEEILHPSLRKYLNKD